MDNFIALEMAVNRMLLFSSGQEVLDYDRVATEAIHNGMTLQTISSIAEIFARAAKKLPEPRAARIRPILTGGFVTRLKMEATGLQQRVAK